MDNGSNRDLVTASPSTQPSTSLREDRLLVNVEEDRKTFASIVGPALALVAPTGMDAAERKAWLGAAFAVLIGYPVDVLRWATKAAMMTADHPSKVVPAIVAASATTIAARREDQRRKVTSLAAPVVVESDDERLERETVGELMKGLVTKLQARHPAESAEDRNRRALMDQAKRYAR